MSVVCIAPVMWYYRLIKLCYPYQIIGQTGEVLDVDGDGNINVSIGGDAWILNPLCLKLEDEKKSPSNWTSCL